MIAVRTEFSTYELDTAGKRIRRLTGRNEPTPRQGSDGDWREYVAITCVIGQPLFVMYNHAGQGTLTTIVQSMEEMGEA